MFICTFGDCSASFNKRWKLIEHEAKHTGNKPFVCTHEGCTKAFTRQPHLQRHLSSHSNQRDFLCEEEGCGAAFKNKDNLKRHLCRVHRDRKYKCDYEGCGKTFHKHQHLTVHQYIHTNIKPFKCEEEGCEARFLIPSKLKAHMKIHKGYTCSREGCNEWFSKWSELTAHLATHVMEFPCTECTMVFNKKHKLRNHMMVHATEREVFVCPKEDCERRFMKRESLRLHISKFHEGARPFSCAHPGCMKTFSYKKSLVQHQVVHEPGYQKPPAKPRKRRSLASRLTGHADLEEPDLLSSPLHTMTFDPGKEDPPKSPKMDTELQEETPHPSSSGHTPVPSATSSRGSCSTAVTHKPKSIQDETFCDDNAEIILLDTQASKLDSQHQEETPHPSSSGHTSIPPATSSRGSCSLFVTQKPKSIQYETVGVNSAEIILLDTQASKMDSQHQEDIPSTSSSDQARMPSKSSSKPICSKVVKQKPISQEETDLDVCAANILVAMQDGRIHVT